MADHVVDATGLRCPQPITKVIMHMSKVSPGETIEVRADCGTFEDDIRGWCRRSGKTLLAINKLGDGTAAAHIQG